MHIPARFASLFDNLGLNDRTQHFIIESHTSPDRHYHGLGHLALMMNYLVERARDPDLDEARQKIVDRAGPNLMIAALFHDIIYDAKATAGKNEEDSAVEFRLRHPRNRWVDTDLVVDMILATRSHKFLPETDSRAILINNFLRADLHILWHPKSHVYQWYARGVRKEYAWVPNDKYREGRAKVLEHLSSIRQNLTLPEIAAFEANQDWEKRALLSGALDV